MRLRTIVRVVALLFSVPTLAGAGKPHVTLPYDQVGMVAGAEYNIRVPANWNGTLLVFAHGYLDITEPPLVALPGSTAGDLLLAEGFALVGSNYEGTGWQVKEGMSDLVALTNFFNGHVGKPDRTIIWGRSMGGLMTLGLIEKYTGIFDGAVALCAPAAGTALAYDRRLAFALSYDVAFGWSPTWGPLNDPVYPLDFNTQILPLMLPTLADSGKWEFIRLVNDLPFETFYAAGYNRFYDMYFSTVARGELNLRAGGPSTQNLDHYYALPAEQKAYLATLGVDADAMLAAMNERTIYAATPSARNYVEHWVVPTGDIVRPVLTMHTILDGLTNVDHESLYRLRVEAAGKSDLLVQTYTNGFGHCAITPAQVLAGIQAMMSWLDTGIAPDASFFPASLGFDNTYVPPAWPFGGP